VCLDIQPNNGRVIYLPPRYIGNIIESGVKHPNPFAEEIHCIVFTCLRGLYIYMKQIKSA
jgi:RIO-like serine/threonine protein kinase